MTCEICSELILNYPNPEPEEPYCADCLLNLPASLIKSIGDPFDYACRLRTGEIVFFEHAEVRGGWVTLFPPSVNHGPLLLETEQLRIPAPRGLNVRISDIVWCADAPFDS